ncbi:MAG: plsY [Actinomycetia bacterium]|nr:plsY [Actinomycetes bacterium]
MSFRRIVESAAIGYLLGTIPSADIVSRIATRGSVDIRSEGSGNPGGFNTMRVVGKKWGVAVIVADVAKGALGGWAGRTVGGDAGAYVGATASIAGHIWPVWFGFNGGKGIGTAGGAALGVFPAYWPIDASVVALSAAATRNSERSAQITAAAWTVASILWWRKRWPNAWGPEPSAGLVAFSAAGSAMVVLKFRQARLAASGTAA